MNEANPTGGVNHERSESSNAPGDSKRNKFFYARFFVLLGLAAAVVAVGGFGAYKVYAKTSTDKFSLAIAKVFRLPALKVGDEKILYPAYVDDLKAIHIMRDYDKAQRDAGAAQDRSPGADLTEEQMSDQVLWRLVNNLLVESAAKKYGIAVEDKDIQNLKEQMLRQFKDEIAANEELNKRYGWNMGVYEQKVMRPFVLQTKLSQKIKEDVKTKENARTQAEKILQEIKNGADFAALAKQYSSDSSGERGGDLGWFGKGEMVLPFEQAVYSLKKGEIYPTLVETVYGYHVVKLDDRKTEKVKNAQGKIVNAEKARASHILFRFDDLTTYLDRAAKNAKIRLYINVHNPFAGLLTSSSSQ
jgi:parvulin-like peptidyl-prolyl isomerase